MCRLFVGWDERGSGAAEFGLIPTRDAVVGIARLGPGGGPLFFVSKLPCYASSGGKQRDEVMRGVTEAAVGSKLEK